MTPPSVKPAGAHRTPAGRPLPSPRPRRDGNWQATQDEQEIARSRAARRDRLPTSRGGTRPPPGHDTAIGGGMLPRDTACPVRASSMLGMAESRYAEDIIVGSIERLGSWTVTRDAIVSFAREWDPQRSHTDDAWAEQSQMGSLIASGVHTLAILQRLLVDSALSTFETALGRAIHEVRMLRPVKPGDTLTGTCLWEAVTLRSDGRALVRFWGRLHNQDGELAFEHHCEMLVPSRAPASR
jgi:acyl dehydratase